MERFKTPLAVGATVAAIGVLGINGANEAQGSLLKGQILATEQATPSADILFGPRVVDTCITQAMNWNKDPAASVYVEFARANARPYTGAKQNETKDRGVLIFEAIGRPLGRKCLDVISSITVSSYMQYKPAGSPPKAPARNSGNVIFGPIKANSEYGFYLKKAALLRRKVNKGDAFDIVATRAVELTTKEVVISTGVKRTSGE